MGGGRGDGGLDPFAGDEPARPGDREHPLDPHAPENRPETRRLFADLRRLDPGSAEYADLRDQLVRMHLPLAEDLVSRFRRHGEPDDDLMQVATIGLIKSVDRFDPERGVEFSTYATPTVVGEIKRHFRDKGWAVRVPRRLQQLHLSLTTATAELSQRLGRPPTVHELAERLGILEEEVLEGLESANAYSTLSLDVSDTLGDESPAVADALGAEDEALEDVEYRKSLTPLLEYLPPLEKRIMLLRLFGNMTVGQIAQEVGISRRSVSQLLAHTHEVLRLHLLLAEPSRCRVRVTLLDDDPQAGDSVPLTVELVAGSAHPWARSGARPALDIVAVPLSAAEVEPTSALYGPGDAESTKFRVTATGPGPHRIRFTFLHHDTGVTLQQVEADLDIGGARPTDAGSGRLWLRTGRS